MHFLVRNQSLILFLFFKKKNCQKNSDRIIQAIKKKSKKYMRGIQQNNFQVGSNHRLPEKAKLSIQITHSQLKMQLQINQCIQI